jgi:sphingomyelin phosphodiesterase
LQDPSDPGDMLKWIESELSQSEKIGQKVYLIGHIPPKSNLNDWAIRFNAIVDRYAYIIRGQFYGHTHSDHVSFFPQMKNAANVSTAALSNYYLVSPSLTTYSDRIPEYRVMDVDFDTLQVIDYSQYRYKMYYP